MGSAGRTPSATGRVVRMYHPSLLVPDLREAEAFFARVFGRPSTRLSSMFEQAGSSSGSRRPVPDHATFTLVGDVLVDSIDPRRYVVAGEQRYRDVDRPRLQGIGWYVDGIGDLYRSLRRRGVVLVDQLDAVADGDEPPTAVGSPMPLYFTVPADAGLRHELVPEFPFPLDPRSDPAWTLPPPRDDDPLGIVRCAHHTILTAAPQRARHLLVDALGGRVVHTGRDEVLGAAVTSVALADAVLRLAVLDDGSSLDRRSVADGADEYHSIAWLVVDLDLVEAHLRAQGVGVLVRTDDSIVADPQTALGIPWRFTTVADPGDQRGP